MKEAYGTLNLAVSLSDQDKKSFEEKLQVLHSMNLQIESITLKTCDGKLVTLQVHDWELDWENIFEEEAA